MERLSKVERKRLRREAEQSARLEEYFSHVVAETATLAIAGPEKVVADARLLGVRLEHRRIDEVSHAFLVPAMEDKYAVVLGYGRVSKEILAEAKSYHWSVARRDVLQPGMPVITYRAKICLDAVIDFIHLTITRILGRLTHGVLISGTGKYVTEDWISWSLDYMDPDMFKVTRVYDNPPPDFGTLLERFPQLRSSS